MGTELHEALVEAILCRCHNRIIPQQGTKPRTSHVGINWMTEVYTNHLKAKGTSTSLHIPRVIHNVEDEMYAADPIFYSMLSFYYSPFSHR